MKFDIVFVTYNSEKWIDNCFNSILALNYELKDISIIIVDNSSTDKTIERLNKFKQNKGNSFNDFTIIEAGENLGFGKGFNLGVGTGKSEFALILNVDTTLYPDTLAELKKDIAASSKKDAVWELRQFPYEHPKLYNPITLTTNWCSGAAFVIRKTVFEELEGFDKHIFMYAEDVDLSWRIRASGYNLKYVPKAVVNHYCYEAANEIKPNQYYNSLINNLLLRYKFGALSDIIKGYIKFLRVLMGHEAFKGSKKGLRKRFWGHFLQIWPYLGWKLKNLKKLKSFKPSFYGWDYDTIRHGAFYVNELPSIKPLVSVVVRTCNRPDVLRETLISLRNQTYRNFEVVIIEDGKNTSESMIRNEFSDLTIKYKALGENQGRAVAGNLGMEISAGKYINFLDDDDVMYSDHLEVLITQLEKSGKHRVAYSIAFETPIHITSKAPYEYVIEDYNLMHCQPFNKTLLFHHNYLPIQCVMFERDIYLEEGGFDLTLDYLEDWDLWVRYCCMNDFLFVEKVTSEYRVPANKETNDKRQGMLDDSLLVLRIKHREYVATINAGEAAENVQDIYNSFVFAVPKDSINKAYARHPRLVRIGTRFGSLAFRVLRKIVG